MNTMHIKKTLANTNIAVGVLLPLWWILMGIGLPVSEAINNFDVLIVHPNWVPINLVGLVGCILWFISVPSFFLYKHEKAGWARFIGTVLVGVGVVLFTCIQYYETFLWPTVAKSNPELVKIEGALVFGAPLIVVPLVISGVVLGVGYIVLGISLFKSRVLPVPTILLLTFGAVIFGNGIVFSIRTIGMLAFVIALIWIGNIMRKSPNF